MPPSFLGLQVTEVAFVSPPIVPPNSAGHLQGLLKILEPLAQEINFIGTQHCCLHFRNKQCQFVDISADATSTSSQGFHCGCATANEGIQDKIPWLGESLNHRSCELR